ncbi:MAG: Glyoxalase/bleomycin resistance protein/dioxygenase [Sediminibacterium sp.]|nr:Glyoxalase/bleomycin resistance protein/dioxygenase [Sediminibacterium sp.]
MIKDTNLTIKVKNMDSSITFYQSIGFTLKNRWGDHYAQVLAPGMVIGLHPGGDGTGSPNISIGFSMDNVEETKNALADLSISITERNEEGGQFLHFSDPDGISLYFIKPKW